MPFNINSFRANISDFGVLPTNKFELYVNPPNILVNSSVNNLDKEVNVRDTIAMMKFRTESLNTPGISLLTAPVNRYGIGPVQRYPVNADQFPFLTLTIISDRYGDIWQFWYNWIRTVWQFNGVENGSATGASSRFATYTAEYKDEYSSTMQILIYDAIGEVQQTINLYEAFPVTLREIPLAWDSNDELLKINVTISYKDYTLVGSTVSNTILQNAINDQSATNGSAASISSTIQRRIITP